MHRLLPHPATIQLLLHQAVARLRRTVRRFRGPRHLVLSILALLLALVWLGQVGVSVLFREPADPERLAVWIPLGLLSYAIYHLLKTACRTPLEPFEWTPAEQELLGGSPLRRYDLVLYRLISIAMAALAKAACFSLLMLPDLKVPLAGFAGMLLALLFVDLLRMASDIIAYGMTRREFLIYRLTVLATAAILVGIALIDAIHSYSGAPHSDAPASISIALHILNSLIDLRNTAVGVILMTPFGVFASVMLSPDVSWSLAAHLVLAAILVFGLAGAVVSLDRRGEHRRIAMERNAYARRSRISAQDAPQRRKSANLVRVPWRLRGVGALAWRQALGALHYRTSLGVAMIVPAFLSCLTLLTPCSGRTMLIQLVGGLVFYSFLLLPTAFKFDFRRDVDRLSVLKALPISPAAVTLGQLAVPVLLCTLFQLVVLLIAMLYRPYHAGLLLSALALLLPTNVLIFSLENLIFLLYPYRLNQEGLGVFFRSILTFTGKGILFAVGLAIALLWALVARHIAAPLLPRHPQAASSIIFIAGLWMLVTMAATGTTSLLIGAYRRFDPSQDTPAA